MFILKKLLNLIDKGVIETREELEVFNHYAELETDKCGEFTYTDWQFLLKEKLIYVNVSELLDGEGYWHEEDFLDALEKHLPLEILNPENINSDDFFDDIKWEILEQVEENFIKSYRNPIRYIVFLDEDGEVFTVYGDRGTHHLSEKDTLSVNIQGNPYGIDDVDEGYEIYLKEEDLDGAEDHFDEYLKEYVSWGDFDNYKDSVISDFYELLDE